VDTLEKLARALEVPMYQLFHNGETKAVPLKLNSTQASEWGASGRDAETLQKFRTYLGKLSARNHKLLVAMATKLARG
jgi:hypothetical protein